MRHARIILAVLAATISLSAPAEARRHHQPAPQGVITSFCGDRVCPVLGPQGTAGRQGRAARGDVAASRTARGGAERRQASPRASQGESARGGYLTVPTAAGIALVAAPSFAGPAAAVIADLVAAGYKPRKLGSLSFARSHVPGSYHFRAKAVDVDQCGWGCTPAPKQTLRMIVARHGLRDGCEFRDAGHFDAGPHLPHARVVRNCGREYADAISSSRQRQAAAGIEPGADRVPPFYPATAELKDRRHARTAAGRL